MPDILLALIALVTLVAALGVVCSKEAVHSALFLTVHLLGIGGLFLALNHQFLAVAQLLVYAGAVMVVFMFAVTTLSPKEEPLNFLGQNGLPLLGAATGLLIFGGLLMAFSNDGPMAREVDGKMAALQPAHEFALDLFGTFLLPFEGTAFLLLTALIGAIILGGRRQLGDG